MLSAEFWGNVEATVDAAGPLNAARTVRGRFVASGLAGNGWRDDMEHNDSLLRGALDADLGERTTAGIGLSYQTEDIDGYSWATQFFEFVKRIADDATDGTTVRLPPEPIQPMAAMTSPKLSGGSPWARQ